MTEDNRKNENELFEEAQKWLKQQGTIKIYSNINKESGVENYKIVFEKEGEEPIERNMDDSVAIVISLYKELK